MNFVLVSDRVIRRYNVRYLKHDYATDVIAFPMQDEYTFGDILISTDTAKRQAKECGHSLFREIVTLAVHGVLHLVGYRDKTGWEKKKMWKRTDELLEKILS